MFQITNHKEEALNASIPYLLKFPEFYKLVEQSGDRAQVIEDIAWELLYNLDYNTASGIWLDYIGKKVAGDREYVIKPTGAFTFGGTSDEGFGEGKFQSASSINSSRSVRTDFTFRNAIKAKIITNNTNTSLSDIIQACKLLYNAKIVNIKETYPARINMIGVYGSDLIQDINVISTIKTMTGAGISVGQVIYYNFYNLFKNNAFIQYDNIIPSSDDFELSFIVKPNTLNETENTALLSQGKTWREEIAPVRLYYDVENEEGVVFRLSPSVYNDSYTGDSYYNDGDDNIYNDSTIGLYLNGGTLLNNEDNVIKVTRVGNVWSLYVNDTLVDTTSNSNNINSLEDAKLFLGASNSKYYNSGSIYNLFLKNNTTNTILINDPLKTNTIGLNNGVVWI